MQNQSRETLLNIAKMIATIGVIFALLAGWLLYSYQQNSDNRDKEITAVGLLKNIKYSPKTYEGSIEVDVKGEILAVNVNRHGAFLRVALGNAVDILKPNSDILVALDMPVQVTYEKRMFGNVMVELEIGENFHLKRFVKLPASEKEIANANLLLMIAGFLIVIGVGIHLRDMMMTVRKTAVLDINNEVRQNEFVVVDGKKQVISSRLNPEFKENLIFHGMIWFGFTLLFVAFVYLETGGGFTENIQKYIPNHDERALKCFLIMLPWLGFLYVATVVKTEFKNSNIALTTPNFWEDVPFVGKYIKAYVYVFRGFEKHVKDSFLAMLTNPFQGVLSLIAYVYPILLFVGWVIFTHIYKI